MVWTVVKGIITYLAILVGFALLLLLPREIKITHLNGFVFTAEYPFSLTLFKNNILSLINFIQAEKGFGRIKTGMKVSENTILLFTRSLKIILPCFIASFVCGVLAGALHFKFHEKALGKFVSFFNWMFSSIPDFFLYIAIQYILIKLTLAGLPNINLYGNDKWYSFIIPVIALMIFPTTHIAKYTAASLLYESKMDYVRTSIAKGMGETQILLQILRNSTAVLLHQTQIVMLYILSSLPIIEKLSNYHGAGYQLLESILTNQDPLSLALMIPFLFLMAAVITSARLIKKKILPMSGGDE
jgi:oligopeptide transport system permease protein